MYAHPDGCGIHSLFDFRAGEKFRRLNKVLCVLGKSVLTFVLYAPAK
jgi:hypothetical protein